jgi:hypothetical protein
MPAPVSQPDVPGQVPMPAATPATSEPTSPATPSDPVQSPVAPTASGECTFAIDGQLSDVIPTVGIVQWSVDLPAIDDAKIEFGLDTNYGLVAPVDLEEPNLRTLLLGMKASHEYHYRIVATGGGVTCESADGTFTTGDAPNGEVAAPDISTPLPDQVTDGYLITGRWGDGNDGPAFILDKDRDFVWWYEVPGDVIRARMSYDGKSMWMRNTAQAQGTGVVLRVSLDGLTEDRWDLGMTTHDLAVLPDGKIGLTAWDGQGCAEILEFNPDDGTTKTLINAQEAHGGSMCHVNNLQYYAEDDTYTFSDYDMDCFVKISREGEVIWVLNGSASDFTGTSWTHQHGLHILSQDHLLLFSNGGAGENSIVYEYQLDRSNMTATELWSYDGGISATYGGDVQRLENGNTIVTYSSAGIIEEVNPDKEVVQELTWPIGNSISYLTHQDSLYESPPPKIWRFDDDP